MALEQPPIHSKSAGADGRGPKASLGTGHRFHELPALSPLQALIRPTSVTVVYNLVGGFEVTGTVCSDFYLVSTNQGVHTALTSTPGL